MKKALLIGLTVGLAVVLAAPAFAIDWSARGQIAIYAAYYKNMDTTYPVTTIAAPYQGEPTYDVPIGGVYLGGVPYVTEADYNEENAWTQLRTVLVVTARASENLAGIWAFEIDSGRWGEVSGSGASTSLGTGYAGQWNADAIAVEVKAACIDFKIPQTPVFIKAGIQNYQVRPHMFLLLDAAGVTARTKLSFDPVSLGLYAFWGKEYEGLDHTQSDDQDLYGIDVNVGVGNIKGGAFFAYQADRQQYNAPGVEGDRELWWIGAYSDIKVGPVGATLDFIWSDGKDDYDTVGYQDIDHEGFVVRGEVTYILNKFKFGVGALYGSGDDRDSPDEYEGYMVPNNSESAFFNKDFVVLTGDWGLFNPYGNAFVGGLFKPRSNIGAGVWYVRAFVDYQVLSWLKLMTNFGYIGDTTEGTNQTLPNFTVLHNDTFGRDYDDDDDIGWEVDLGAQVQIYPNLYLCTTFGYIFAGDALADQADGYHSMSDPWAWMSTLTFIF